MTGRGPESGSRVPGIVSSALGWTRSGYRSLSWFTWSGQIFLCRLPRSTSGRGTIRKGWVLNGLP